MVMIGGIDMSYSDKSFNPNFVPERSTASLRKSKKVDVETNVSVTGDK